MCTWLTARVKPSLPSLSRKGALPAFQLCSLFMLPHWSLDALSPSTKRLCFLLSHMFPCLEVVLAPSLCPDAAPNSCLFSPPSVSLPLWCTTSTSTSPPPISAPQLSHLILKYLGSWLISSSLPHPFNLLRISWDLTLRPHYTLTGSPVTAPLILHLKCLSLILPILPAISSRLSPQQSPPVTPPTHPFL